MHSLRREPGGAPTAPPEAPAGRGGDAFVDAAGPATHAVATRLRGLPRGLRSIVVVIGGYVAVVVVLLAIGMPLVHAGALGGVRSWDEHVARFFADHRVGWLNPITEGFSRAADTTGVIAGAVVVELVLLVRHRFRALLLLAVALPLELLTFLLVNAVVARDRPDVVRIGSEPGTSSFPSGHTAATLVLWASVALLFVPLTATRRRAIATGLVVIGIDAAVAFARVYRGMHHPTDVVAGAAMGAATLAVAVVAIRTGAGPPGTAERARDDEPARYDERLPAASLPSAPGSDSATFSGS